MPSAPLAEASTATTPPQTIPGASPQAESLAANVADTTRNTAPADSASAFSAVNDNFNEGLRLILSGEWEAFWRWGWTGLVNLLGELFVTLVGAGFFLLFAYAVYRVAKHLLDQFLERNRRVDTGLQRLLMKTFRIAALTLIAVMLLDRFEFNVTALFAGLGIAGIAIGFAARDSLENFISGVTILMDRPFRVGDNVEIEGHFGTVEDITLRSTRIRTLNNQIMVMPNVQMINQKLLNHTMMPVLRVEVRFGIAYKEHPQEAREVLLEMVGDLDDERLHEDYKPSVIVTEMGSSSVDMVLRLFLKNPKQEVPVRWEYTEKVREALREAGIEIPYPHLQLFVDEAEAFEGAPWMPDRPHAPALSDGASGSDASKSEEASAAE